MKFQFINKNLVCCEWGGRPTKTPPWGVPQVNIAVGGIY